MTISTTTNRISYAGNASTTAFATGFKFFADGDLTVTLVTDSTGAEAVQVLTTDYTVASAGVDSGGTVTMGTAPATGETLVIERTQAYTQGLDLVENDPFPSDSVEDQLDKLAIMAQQNNSLTNRTLRQPDGDTAAIDRLPPKVTRATKVMAFDADGDPVASTLTLAAIESGATDAAASAVTAANEASAAAASATLASEWASKTDGQVATTDYSSKAWAIGGTGVTDTATAGAAKEWATAAEDDLVDGSEYSAKHYSAKSATSATNAAASETAALAAAQGWAAVTSVTAATTNIEITDGRTYYLLDATSNTVDINLPAIGTDEGVTYAFEVVNVDNAITIVRDGTDYINGANGDYSGLTAVGDVIYFTSDDSTPDNWIATLVTRVNADESTLTLTGRTMSILDNGVTPAKVSGSVNAQTGTTYTLVIGDAFKTVTMSNVSANTLTIPPNSSVAFAVGDRIDIVMLAAGVTSVVGGSGVTVNGVSTGTGAIAAQYGAVSCLKIATDTWLLMGNHGGVA